ncbi:phosphopantetheine-binding protein [Paractinoplanes rishiriensis]|uniref:Carrier domain-containing protein n=1 Tax=Paractinoplanes rishiriensis TaxID=1050105 RepID=A0A919K6E0_9ACTN|nr:phosphopantetheine-binding protein [Actinoplanes rishiriensis]GIE99529.1 hypothetical protein Ari01nite_69940 [Actinoplanes rishiriensis]
MTTSVQNGPADRAGKGLSSAYRQPGTPLEADLARLFAARLQVAPVGVDDDFFELGGHSLMAAELLLDIEQELGFEVTARTLFLQPTIAQLAATMAGTEER